ncbi:MAG: type I glyceraldehyde-3-phosphate dehydrogenase [Deinococcales bacterium]
MTETISNPLSQDKMNIGINGFGRIGRQIFRIMHERGQLVKMINVRKKHLQNLAYLLKYDSSYGPFKGDIALVDEGLLIDGELVIVSDYSDPAMIPWQQAGVDIVVESTGKFLSHEQVAVHLRSHSGAKKVLISAPSPDADFDVVYGVNEHEYNSSKHHIVSNASCTTNSLAPVMKVIEEAFGIEQAMMSTVHSYTNDQRILDGTHKDPRRARAASVNIIPTSTGAAKAVGKVLPQLAGRFDGIALRVPTPTGSLSDVTLLLKEEVTAEEVNRVLREAALGELKGVLEVSEDPLVLQDIVGSSASAIIDSLLTKSAGRMLKLCIWYDNEWGYSSRMVDMLRLMQEKLANPQQNLMQDLVIV